jgi:Zn-dependent protease
MRHCPECDTEVSPTRLSCPACQRLLHKEELERLALKATRAEEAGAVAAEVAAWRQALELLPPESGQHASIAAKLAAVSPRLEEGDRVNRDVEAASEAGTSTRRGWRWAGFSALALLVWKLKTVLAFLLTKGKLLALGLTKSGTAVSMALAFGVYWAALGWPFAAGLVASIYVHEMGHVSALRQLGIAASAPMFIPGVGAFVRLKQSPASMREDARVGLAGPLWGLAAAVAAWLAFLGTGIPIWGAIARFGAWVNLFNLLPVWPLDGGRGFRALSRAQRWGVTFALGGAWYLTGEGLLVLVGLAAAAQAWGGEAPDEGDRPSFVTFLLLVAVLAGLCTLPVPLQ